MISIDDLKRIVENPNPAFKKLRYLQQKYELHVKGGKRLLTKYLEKIEGFEDEQQFDVRAKYAKSNKDIFKSLSSPLEKIFSAKGGSKIYHFSSDKIKETFENYILNVRDGMSLSKWTENYWKTKAAIDPNGLFLVEHKDNKPFPTFTSIQNIIEYETNGMYVNWVVFAPYKDKDNNEYYRVYDELGDNLYKKTNDNFVLVEEKSYLNPWGYVPGIIVSDLLDTETGFSKSIYEEQIEIADHLLLEGSIKTSYMFKFGFPLNWMYRSVCNTCKGTREVKGERCPSCNGSGYDSKRDVSKILLIDPPEDGQSPVITPNIAGYISPDISAMNQFNIEIDKFKDNLWFSKWGTTLEHQKSETATGRFIDAQPVSDTLNMHADSVEKCEELLTDIIAEYLYRGFYKGASINIGRRFLIETPDQLINKYIEAKQKRLSEIQLTYLLLQYYQTEFSRDAYQYTKYKKLLRIDPFPHLTIMEVLPLAIPEETKKIKLYIDEWSREIDQDLFINKNEEQLKTMLKDYANGKTIQGT